jgi:hypothetical protein
MRLTWTAQCPCCDDEVPARTVVTLATEREGGH